MPIYRYKCENCGTSVEKEVPIAERGKQSCETCGSLLLQVPAPFSFTLKGKGWSKDGYQKKKGEA